jgi:hypothetical protein
MCKLTKDTLLRFNTSVQQYQGPKQVVIASYLNAISVKNEGTTLVIFQGDTLQPGESKSIGGNFGEIYDSRIDIFFQTQVPAPAVINNLAVVTQKFYLFDNE